MSNLYEWSPQGLQMLQDIENSIRSYGGSGKLLLSLKSEHHKGYACSKGDCYYCNYLTPDIKPEISFRKKYTFRQVKEQIKFQKRDFSTKNFNY